MGFNVPVPTPPGGATLVSPTGSIGDNNPTYTWNKVSASTWYYLSVSGPSGYAFTHWYDASAVCGESTCSIANATSGLAPGAYTWKVQTWNTAGYGPWSSDMSFSIPIPWPGQPTLISPNGSTTDLTPTYSWNAVSSETGDPATWYYLSVDGPAGNIINQWYTAAAVGCSSGSGTCSITPGVVHMPIGTYDWWVLGYNAAGNGPWSDGMSFTLASTGGFDSQFNGDATNWTPYYGTWEIVSSQWYRVFGNNDYFVSSGYTGANYANFDVQTRVATTSPHLPYFIVRGTPAPFNSIMDWNSAYLFGFDTNGFYDVEKIVNGSWQGIQPWTYTPSLVRDGGWNTLRVIASENYLYFYINGNLVWSGVDASLASGQIGFELGTTPSYGLWVDWVTLNSYAEDLPIVTDTISAEQQALNEAAKNNGSDKEVPDQYRK